MCVPIVPTADIRSDIHGAALDTDQCDYCKAPLSAASAPQYDAIRVDGLESLARAVDVPDGWFLDAARCDECRRTSLSLPSKQFGEALIGLETASRGDSLVANAGQLTVSSYSGPTDGWRPPQVSTRDVSVAEDIGIARWERAVHLLQSSTHTTGLESFESNIRQSPEIPPEVAQYLS